MTGHGQPSGLEPVCRRRARPARTLTLVAITNRMRTFSPTLTTATPWPGITRPWVTSAPDAAANRRSAIASPGERVVERRGAWLASVSVPPRGEAPVVGRVAQRQDAMLSPSGPCTSCSTIPTPLSMKYRRERARGLRVDLNVGSGIGRDEQRVVATCWPPLSAKVAETCDIGPSPSATHRAVCSGLHRRAEPRRESEPAGPRRHRRHSSDVLRTARVPQQVVADDPHQQHDEHGRSAADESPGEDDRRRCGARDDSSTHCAEASPPEVTAWRLRRLTASTLAGRGRRRFRTTSVMANSQRIASAASQNGTEAGVW